MNLQSFADFITRYSYTNFCYVEDQAYVASLGIVEEWGEFVGEYKRLVRDSFSVEAVSNFEAKAPIELADVIAYCIIRMNHLNFNVIDVQAIERVPIEEYPTLREWVDDVSLLVNHVALQQYGYHALVARLVKIGSFMNGGIEKAFDDCVAKLQSRSCKVIAVV